jgi:Adenylate and Guanylate cyclase catalytic domain
MNVSHIHAFSHNLAARMESNSCNGRIQVSETTAQLLCAANKHHWLIKREDPIDAKGKGTLQTYWLDINAKGSSIVGSLLALNENNLDDHAIHPPLSLTLDVV